MMQIIWGTLAWDMLLLFAQAYPDEPSEKEQESMFLFLTHFFARVPCQLPCGEETKVYVNKHPITVTSKQAVLTYIVTFHNYVNEKTAKRSDWTVLEAIAACSLRHASNLRALSRADQTRIEDHQMMKELMEENNKLREQLGLPWKKENPDYETGIDFTKKLNEKVAPMYQGPEDIIDISTILIVVLSLIIFFAFMMAFLTK
jgi:hypothetical protein